MDSIAKDFSSKLSMSSFTNHGFLSTRRPQSFGKLASYMPYICKNLKSPIAYQKLLQTCKYFYYFDRVIILRDFNFHQLSLSEEDWQEGFQNQRLLIDVLIDGVHYIDLKVYKLWFTGTFSWPFDYHPRALSSFLQYVKHCDITEFEISSQRLSFEELKFLIKDCTLKLKISSSEFFFSNGKAVSVGDILTLVPNIEEFYYASKVNELLPTCSSELPRLPKLSKFVMSYPVNLNCNTFAQFVRLHPGTIFRILYANAPNPFVNQLKAALRYMFPSSDVYYREDGLRILFDDDKERMTVKLFLAN